MSARPYPGKLSVDCLNRTKWLYARHLRTLFLICMTGFRAAGQDRIYASNSAENNVVVIDATNLSVVATISVGQEPTEVAISPDGKLLYVSNGASSSISVISTSTNAVTATIPLSGFPTGAAFSPDSKLAYVCDGLGVAVINVTTNAVSTHIPLGTFGSHIAITSDGAHAYVSGGNGNLYVLDLTANSIVQSIPIPGATDLRAVAVTPDGRHAYVVSVYQAAVFVIDTASNSVTGSITVGSLPVGMAITPDGLHAYVAATYGPVSELDLTSNTVVANITVPNHPLEITISADGTHAFVTDQIQAVAEIDTGTNSVVAEIATHGHPSGVAITPHFSPSSCSNLTISSVRPNTAGNTGTATLTLTGCLFSDGIAVTLKATGQPDITASSVSVVGAGALTAVFDLTGAVPGTRDVVVSGSNGTATLPSAFTVTPGGSPQLWANVVGVDKIRVGRQQVFVISYGNTGGVDALGVHLIVSFPSSLASSLVFGNANGVATTISSNGNTVVLVNVGRVAAGSTTFLPITITAVAGQSAFQIQAQISSQ